MASRPPWERYSAPDQSQPVVTRQADPRLPAQVRQANNEAAASANAPALSDAQLEAIRLENENRRLQIQQGQQQLTQAQIAAQNAATQQGTRLRSADTLERLVNGVEDNYNQNFRGVGLGSILEYLPTPSHNRMQTDAEFIRTALKPLVRQPGEGTFTDADQALIDALVPSPNAADSSNEQRIANLRNMIADIRRQNAPIGAPQGTPAPAASAPREQVDRTQPLVVGDNPNAGPNLQLSHGLDQMDPARLQILRQAQQRITGMLRAGRPDSEIADYARQQGLDASAALQFRQTPAFRQWSTDPRTRNEAYPLDLTSANVPMSGPASAVAGFAASPLGTGVTQAINGALPGAIPFIGDLAGNGEQTRLGLEAQSAENPGSALAGNVLGAMVPYSVGGRIASRIGGRLAEGAPTIASLLRPATTTALTPRAIAGDALYGAFQGYGENQDPLSGAAEGVVGGMFGRGAVRGLGRGLRGIQDRSVRYLTGLGVPLTIGEIAGAGNGVGGRVVSGVEDRLAGLPAIGDFINARRLEGRQGFNRAAFRRGAGVDATGSTAVRQSQRAASDAYRAALDGVNLTADLPFRNDWNAARRAAGAIPGELGDQAGYVLDQANGLFGPGASLTGDNLQAARQYLRQARGGASGPLASDFRNVMTSGEGALTDLANRQSPGTTNALTRADNVYRNSSVLGDAVLSAKNQSDELFTPAQLATADVNNTTRFGGRNAARAGRTPFYALRRAGQDVIGNRVPDSGTAGRLQTAGALGILPASGAGLGALANPDDRAAGASSGAQTALELGALFSLPYTRVGRSLLQRALVSRTRAMRNAGNYILNDTPAVRIGGMFGAPLVDYESGRGY